LTAALGAEGGALGAAETAEARKKNPARAILLSMGVSCGDVVANDAEPPMSGTNAFVAQGLSNEHTNEKPRVFAVVYLETCFSDRTRFARRITVRSRSNGG
jgi:hypothetical protein